ncbi:MAG: hypothetical protein ACOCQG_04920 [Candidatus Nanoarchaeia archaeon]
MDFKELNKDLEHITEVILKHTPLKNPVLNELYSMHKNINPLIERDKFTSAFLISAGAHANRQRFKGEPFFSHECRTAYICNLLSKNNTVIYIGQMHDCVEDSKSKDSYALEIYKKFGRDVFLGVIGLCKLQNDTNQFFRLECFRDKYVSNIEIVKISDVLDNLTSVEYLPARPGETAKERQVNFCDTANNYGISMAERFDKANKTNVAGYMRELLEMNYKRLNKTGKGF